MNAIITPSASQKEEIISIPYNTYKIEIFKIPEGTKFFRKDTSDRSSIYIDYSDSGTVHGWLMNSTTSEYDRFSLFSYVYVKLNNGETRSARMNSVGMGSDKKIFVYTYTTLFESFDTDTNGILNSDLILWRQITT